MRDRSLTRGPPSSPGTGPVTGLAIHPVTGLVTDRVAGLATDPMKETVAGTVIDLTKGLVAGLANVRTTSLIRGGIRGVALVTGLARGRATVHPNEVARIRPRRGSSGVISPPFPQLKKSALSLLRAPRLPRPRTTSLPARRLVALGVLQRVRLVPAQAPGLVRPVPIARRRSTLGPQPSLPAPRSPGVKGSDNLFQIEL